MRKHQISWRLHLAGSDLAIRGHRKVGLTAARPASGFVQPARASALAP